MGGVRTELLDRAISSTCGRFAGGSSPYRGCYAFTGVALDAFEHVEQRGLPRVLDSPNGHIRAFREVIDREARDLLRTSDLGHPTRHMVERIEREYALATKVRVASHLAKRSLVAGGVTDEKIHVSDLEVDIERFSPSPSKSDSKEFRVCYAGSVDLRKGVVYLLRAIRKLGPGVTLRIVGATGSRAVRTLFDAESAGLRVTMSPGDPVPAYRAADVFALPSLEDGFGYVAAEAMACGLPVIVTDACGASEWVTADETGWIVPARSTEGLATALETARSRKGRLREMGEEARHSIVTRMSKRPVQTYATWLSSQYAVTSRES
jgi:glycosyltransferase involved in cell wall biosynthesis